MPTTPLIEKHFTASGTVGDIVIGMSDGLTVPFALATGLSGAVASTGIVVTAGLAEIAAGSIAMGLVSLSSYLFIRQITAALRVSIGVTLGALFIFGFAKGRFTGTKPVQSGLKTLSIGSLVAAVAFLLARLIG